MSQPKKKIPIEKIEQMSEMLTQFADALKKGVVDLRSAEIDGVSMDGWKTLVRGMGYVHEQLLKIVGPTSVINRLDVEKLNVTGHFDGNAKGKSTTKGAFEAMKAAEPKPEYRKKKQ